MADGRLQYGIDLVKEDTVFLQGGDSGRIPLVKGDLYRGGYSAFLFSPKNMGRFLAREGYSF